MEVNDNEDMGSSPPTTVHMEFSKEEPIDSIDLVEPVDAPTDIAVGRKSPIWAQ